MNNITAKLAGEIYNKLDKDRWLFIDESTVRDQIFPAMDIQEYFTTQELADIVRSLDDYDLIVEEHAVSLEWCISLNPLLKTRGNQVDTDKVWPIPQAT